MNKTIKHLLSIASVCVMIILAVASSNEDTISKTEKPVQNVAAIQIFDDFKENEIAAKEKYGKKIIAVRGIIASIESYDDGAKIRLNDGKPENVAVNCYFNEDQLSSLKTLKKGDPVKVIGIGSESLFIDYDLRACRLGILGIDD
jgi:hypothetical protein